MENEKMEKGKKLYNFDGEEKKKKTKKTKDKKDKKNKNKDKISSNQELNENEIIIGVTRYPDKKEVTNKNKKVDNRKTANKKTAKNIKKNKTKEKYIEQEENKEHKNKKILKVLKWTCIFAIIIAGVIFALISPIFNINSIIIEGNSKLTEQQIIRMSAIENDQNTFKINKKEAKQNIKKNGYIEDVKISRVLPDKIKISIEERTANFLIQYGNAYVYINNQGYILEISDEKLDLPALIGISTNSEDFKEANRLNTEDLKKIGTVLKIVAAAEVNEIYNLITSIDISDENDFKIYFETERKTAYLGDCSNIETRSLYLAAILKNESGKAGEIFVNMNLNTDDPFFRENVEV